MITSVLPGPATDVSLSVIATPPQVSEPVATPVDAELVSPVHSTLTSAGTLILGAVASFTVITTVSEAEFTVPSLTTRLTFLTPFGKVTVGDTPVALPPDHVHE